MNKLFLFSGLAIVILEVLLGSGYALVALGVPLIKYAGWIAFGFVALIFNIIALVLISKGLD